MSTFWVLCSQKKPTYLARPIYLHRSTHCLTVAIRLFAVQNWPHCRLSSNRTLAVARMRTSFGDRNFAVAGPCLWNGLPAWDRSPAMDISGGIWKNKKSHTNRFWVKPLKVSRTRKKRCGVFTDPLVLCVMAKTNSRWTTTSFICREYDQKTCLGLLTLARGKLGKWLVVTVCRYVRTLKAKRLEL